MATYLLCYFSARDAAKFGLPYLYDGIYDGIQVVPADWVHDSLQTYSEDPLVLESACRFIGDIGYGYQWWSDGSGDHHYNLAWGHGGQLIVLLEEFDMVIVTTADSFFQQHDD